MRARDWDDEGEAPETGAAVAEGRALQELRVIYQRADAAYAPYSCPASGECCQLARTGRQPWLWEPEWRLLASRHGLPPPREEGVCGTAAAEGRTIIVPDVRRFPGHIACDARSRSEIVVPVYSGSGALTAVLDIDSEHLATFDERDIEGLERLVTLFRDLSG
jgi:GAF domain-containing protein